MYNLDLALNNLQGLICHKNQPTNQPTIQSIRSPEKFIIKYSFLPPPQLILICIIFTSPKIYTTNLAIHWMVDITSVAWFLGDLPLKQYLPLSKRGEDWGILKKPSIFCNSHIWVLICAWLLMVKWPCAYFGFLGSWKNKTSVL